MRLQRYGTTVVDGVSFHWIGRLSWDKWYFSYDCGKTWKATKSEAFSAAFAAPGAYRISKGHAIVQTVLT